MLSDNQIKSIREIYQDYKSNPDKLPKFKNTLKKNFVFTDPNSGKVFLKLFIFNDKFTKDNWRGNSDNIDKNIEMNLGHPLAIASDNDYIMFAHPGSTKLSYAVNENIQKPFVIGRSIAFDRDPVTNDRFVIYDIENPDAKQFLAEIADKEQIPIPFWSSPQIAYSKSEDDANIKTFKIQHNVLTDSPQFGQDTAIAKAMCVGDSAQCMPVLLQQASEKKFEFEEKATPEQEECPFCIAGRLTQILDNNIKTVQASLNSYNNRNSSHVSENKINTSMSEQTSQQQNNTDSNAMNSRQPVQQQQQTNNNNNNDSNNQNNPVQKFDTDSLQKLIDDAIEKKFSQKKEQEQSPQQKEETKSTNTDSNKEDKPQIDYSQLSPEIKERLQKAEKVEKENKELSQRIYKDDVGNLLLEYFKDNHAFVDEKGGLDEKRFQKVLDYFVKQEKQIDEIKETIEIVSSMYAPSQNKKSVEKEQLVTKKASSNEFQLYDVPSPQDTNQTETNQDDNDNANPYWDRSIVHKSF